MQHDHLHGCANSGDPAPPQADLNADLAMDWYLKALLRSSVEELPQPHRTYIAECFFEGRSYRDIAERHGETFYNVHSRIHDGLAQLRLALEDNDIVKHYLDTLDDE